jgi:predicted O-methyltransferase YrrM
MSTLETGAGGSTVVFVVKGTSHVAISPAPAEHEEILRYCEAEGIDTSGLRFIAQPAHEALVGTWKPEPLDLVLIDGAHAFPYPALDWFFTAKHVRVGGDVLVDDAQLPSVNSLATTSA